MLDDIIGKMLNIKMVRIKPSQIFAIKKPALAGFRLTKTMRAVAYS
jgi:hypothetical protein